MKIQLLTPKLLKEYKYLASTGLQMHIHLLSPTEIVWEHPGFSPLKCLLPFVVKPKVSFFHFLWAFFPKESFLFVCFSGYSSIGSGDLPFLPCPYSIPLAVFPYINTIQSQVHHSVKSYLILSFDYLIHK